MVQIEFEDIPLVMPPSTVFGHLVFFSNFHSEYSPTSEKSHAHFNSHTTENLVIFCRNVLFGTENIGTKSIEEKVFSTTYGPLIICGKKKR